MFWAVRQLLVPVNYLRIRHGDDLLHSKLVYDFILQLLFAAATSGVFKWLTVPLAVFSHPEMVKRIGDLLALMIVFYMAALAAVATFERKGIDDPLKGGDATLRVRNPEGGKREPKVLSYRQFISYLFGFLSFSSLCLYVFIIIFAVGWPKLESHFNAYASFHGFLTDIVDPIIFFLMLFALWQLIFTSLLGIYFLTDRIQTLNDPKD